MKTTFKKGLVDTWWMLTPVGEQVWQVAQGRCFYVVDIKTRRNGAYVYNIVFPDDCFRAAIHEQYLNDEYVIRISGENIHT